MKTIKRVQTLKELEALALALQEYERVPSEKSNLTLAKQLEDGLKEGGHLNKLPGMVFLIAQTTPAACVDIIEDGLPQVTISLEKIWVVEEADKSLTQSEIRNRCFEAHGIELKPTPGFEDTSEFNIYKSTEIRKCNE